MLKHTDFRRGGMVSIWVGNFRSDIELDDYLNLSRRFEQDFGFELNERDMPETLVEPEPVPVSQLITRFSWSGSYADSVLELAEKNAIVRVTTMVVFFNFEYQPDRAKAADDAPLRFIGAVGFS